MLPILTLGIVLPAAALADGFIYVPEPPHPHLVPRPHLHRPPPPHFPMQVTRHRVSVEVADTVARTRVEETFFNPNQAQLEGVYLFPLPLGAAVSGFRMRVGGRESAGEMLEKERARQIYEDIVRRVRDPGLLEYVDRGLFRASVFPIPPRSGIDVTIEYSETLPRDAGVSRWVYPLDTGKYAQGEYQDVVLDVKLRSSLPLRAIHCPSHDVSIARAGDLEARVSFEAKRLRADRDFVLTFNVGDDPLAPILLVHRGHEAEGTFYLAVSPRAERPESILPKDILFVVDTSGSMLGRKIEQVKKALRYCLQGLRASDRFNIVDFSTEARSFRTGLVDASDEAKGQAAKYVDELQARGGTNLEEGLRLGLQNARDASRLQMVVLLTDGEPTIGVVRPEDILRTVKAQNISSRRVFVFGVGEDLNAKLLDQVVRDSRGAAQYIRGEENLELPLSSFFDKIDSPVLTDLKLEFPTGGVSDMYPRPLPDLFRGEQLEVFGRCDRTARRTVVLRANFQGKERVFEYSLDFTGGDHTHLASLWAAQKIGYLLEQMRLSGESRELKDEVIRLSKLYGILTPFTSYLILEEDRGVAVQDPTRPSELRLSYRAAQDALYGAGGAQSPAAGAVREAARDEAEGFAESSGAKAVEFSRRLGELRRARSAAGIDGLAAGSPAPGAAGRGATAEDVRVKKSGDKTFYLQGERWIDSVLTSQAAAGAPPAPAEKLARVVYLSDDYFKLLQKYPGIGKYLSVGVEVTVKWGDELISVVR
jgi:Ca-activated chloride channel family protein